MIVPVRPLGIRHLTNDELPCGDLVADVLELPLACVFLSFMSRVCHRLARWLDSAHAYSSRLGGQICS